MLLLYLRTIKRWTQHLKTRYLPREVRAILQFCCNQPQIGYALPFSLDLIQEQLNLSCRCARANDMVTQNQQCSHPTALVNLHR